MQSPEVHNFPAPATLFSVEKFKGVFPLNNININSFHYNHLLTVIIPNPHKLSGSSIEYCLGKNIFYKVLDFNLEDIADIKFLSSFLRNGKLTLLTINKRIDCDNCFGITPEKKLYLSLNKETYQSCGVEGVLSHYTKKLNNRYIVCIDLGDEKLLSNKSRLQRLRSCLEILDKATVVAYWEPPSEDICPSSIAKFFADLGYTLKECAPNFHSKTLNTQIPKPDLTSGDRIDTFVEWLGMVALDCNLEPDLSTYLSSYISPASEMENLSQVVCCQLQGFFSSDTMIQNIVKITKLLEESPIEWIAVYVQGFSDCPVAWGKEEHHYFVNGDNGYIILFNKDGGLICTHKCSRKRYK